MGATVTIGRRSVSATVGTVAATPAGSHGAWAATCMYARAIKCHGAMLSKGCATGSRCNSSYATPMAQCGRAAARKTRASKSPSSTNEAVPLLALTRCGRNDSAASRAPGMFSWERKNSHRVLVCSLTAPRDAAHDASSWVYICSWSGSLLRNHRGWHSLIFAWRLAWRGQDSSL